MSNISQEDEEPKLSYERITNDLSNIIRTDSISSSCLHEKIFALGTVYGRIHVFDHQGNKVDRQEICVHLKSVNSISIDDKGEYLVSCSNDRLVVYGLCNSEHNFVLMLDRPMNVVAIDPHFYKSGSGRRFVTGDTKVALYERGFLARYKTTILQGKEQEVRAISWHGQFIAWATDLSVQVFDMEQKATITKIKRDFEIDRAQKCQICWKDRHTFMLGWANTVKVCVIKERPLNGDDIMNELPRKYVEIVSMFETDYDIFGLAPFGTNLLTICIDESKTKAQVQILETLPNNYGEISRDLVTLNCDLSYYALLSLHRDGIYFIVSMKDVIIAKPRDHDDHIDWLMQHSMISECYKYAEEHTRNLSRHSLAEIKELYKKELLEKEEFDEAARLSASLCGKDLESWEIAIIEFRSLGHLDHLLPHLPKKVDGFHLPKEIFDSIMDDLLNNDSVSLFKAIREIPSSLYSMDLLIDQIIRNLANDPKNFVLNEALAELYSRTGKFEDAVNIYLDSSDKTKIFSLIRDNNLVSVLRDKLDRLIEIDADETSRLLVENVGFIPMKNVIDKYKSGRFLTAYLHRLFLKDPDSCIEYHDLMVKLYSQYQRESLMNFLKTSTNYRLEEALSLCKEANLIKEVVFLHGRMGDLGVALKYIIESQGDINEAIEFCKEHQEANLWQDLITMSMDNPIYISKLLKNVGTHVSNPIELIDRIPSGCQIDGLIPALEKILRDYQLQISLEETCRDLMAKDCFSLLEKQIRFQTRGIAINDEQLCDHCNQPLISEFSVTGTSRATSPNNLVVFGCHHVFHGECCLATSDMPGQDLICRVCMLDKEYT